MLSLDVMGYRKKSGAMHELLERLGRGDERLIVMCRDAHRVWSEFLAEMSGADTGTLAARLGILQPTFQRLFDSPKLGESMMAWSGFAALYDATDGWGANLSRARQLAEAFALSNCSKEVRDEARACVISYELERADQKPFAGVGVGIGHTAVARELAKPGPAPRRGRLVSW